MLSFSKDKTYDTMLRQIGYGTIKRLLEIEGGTINDTVLGGVRYIVLSKLNINYNLYESDGKISTKDYESVGKIYREFVVSPDKSFKEIVDYCDWEEDPNYYKIKVLEEKFMVAVTKVIYLVIKKELIHLS
jgi:hypothetical protein